VLPTSLRHWLVFDFFNRLGSCIITSNPDRVSLRVPISKVLERMNHLASVDHFPFFLDLANTRFRRTLLNSLKKLSTVLGLVHEAGNICLLRAFA
jgi:hypothetical protein